MKPGQIRPIVVCIFMERDRIFVAKGLDHAKQETFYRPLGGAIEFNEQSRDCVIREIREELNTEIKELTYVGMLENIFTFEDERGHEIVLVYKAKFADSRLYKLTSVRCPENGGEFIAMWKPIADFKTGKAPLYPAGLLELLDKVIDHRNSSNI